MQFFVNKYPEKSSSAFHKLIADVSLHDIIVTGQEGNNGLLVRLDENGELRWGKSYVLKGKTILIYHYDRAANGEYVLLGRVHVESKNRTEHLLLRVSTDGDLQWAKRIKTAYTRNNIGLERIRGDNYVIAGWHNTKGTQDRIELIKINGEGELQAARELELGSDTQVLAMTAVKDELALVGGTNAGTPWNGFLIRISFDLQRYIIHLFNHPVKDTVEDIQAIHYMPHRLGIQQRILLLGRTRQGSYYRSFLAIAQIVKGEQLRVEAISFDVTKGKDNSRKILAADGKIFTLGQSQGDHYAYVCCFDLDLNLLWTKKFELEEDYILTDMQIKNKQELWFSGYFYNERNSYQPLVIKTDLNLTTCKTVDVPNVEITDFALEVEQISRKIKDIKASVKDTEVNVSDHPVTPQVLCPTKVFQPDKTAWLQSPYLYLQSAGSLGNDASEGMLLRWFFLRNLGEAHLPKGDYAHTGLGFNKSNDYVCIYRAEYKPIYVNILFSRLTPVFVDSNELRWVYQSENVVFYLHFLNKDRYQEIRTQIDPRAYPRQFLDNYGDNLLELEIQDKLAFSVRPQISGDTNGQFQLEVFSTQGNLSLSETAITARKILQPGEPDGWRVESENIKKIQFRAFNCQLSAISFEFYEHTFLERVHHQAWTPLGRFALSKDTNEVYKRLEDDSRFQVHAHWQKYNDDAFVNVENYKDRWAEVDDGLQSGVEKYLQLSETDPSATESIEEDDGEASMDVSYFDLLQVASLDYHIARMLGLGHIDTPYGEREKQYIYLAEYHTTAKLDSQHKEEARQHLYMTLPTSLQDERLPQIVETLPATYGLELYTGTDNPMQLTDENGYLPYESIRYVNVKTRLLKDYSQRDGFFQPNWEFESAHYSSPVFGGVEYRKQGESAWQLPEISHDPNYLDAGDDAFPETISLPFPADTVKPLLIHEEKEEGVHEYAAYSVNVFSRASAIHNTVFTDFTRFIKPNTLLPPHNLRVQLIQEENPQLLTSASEQVLLNRLTGNDKTLVRVSFRYNHLHDINFQFGDKVEVFFRDFLPRNIEGGVANISDDANERFAIVSTQPYTFNSTGETLVPNISSALYPNFIGGVLVVGEGRYIIEDIISTHANGDFPKFKIKKAEDRNTVDLGGGNIVTNQVYLSPEAEAGDLFMVIENMARAQSWGNNNPLAYTIELGETAWSSQTEVIEDDESGTVEREIRGIWDSVTITEKTDPVSGDLLPGYYDVVFDNYQLGHHPQWLDPSIDSNIGKDFVEWYQGVLRVNTIGDTADNQEKKTLDVVKIINIGESQNLVLVVHDEAYQNDLGDQNENIKTGNNILINFYPGYRAYIHADSPHDFDENSILPAAGEGSKRSLIELRTVDTTTLDTNNDAYHSKIGVPQILYAQEIINPLPPKRPSGPAYATPPDFYSKSTYTFTTEFRQTPFGAIFYRADVNAILKALYKTETYRQIIEDLPSADQDEYYSDRIQAIANADFDITNREFTAFPISEEEEYAFPEPDNPDYGFPLTDSNAAEVRKQIKSAIYSTFLPLTEQPLIYSAIEGGDYIPKPKKQTIRDKYGKLLNPTDAEYDLAPMAKRIDGRDRIRFTDFTLDGEMSPNTAYLYSVRELGNRMSLSEPSSILGPIQLINTNPPETPVVRKFTTQLENPITGATTAINFQINEYSYSQNIKKVHIYRAIKAVDALSPRTMTLAKEVTLAPEVIIDGIIHIQDDFSDVDIIPYGEALFYRIVALREVIYDNIDGERIVDYVPSKPTKTLLTNIVDVNNPLPPTIEKVAGDLVDDEIVGLTLKWNKTAYNATYYLFKMNSVGNWNKIEEVRSNDETDLTYTFADPVPKTDEDDDAIYHRFKVTVENSSGLLNVVEEVLTL